jgi:threonine/homoserine/homoserine lactone efflux protein
MNALLYGLNAGLGFSPHTLGMVMKTIVSGRRSGLIFMLSGFTLDLILIVTAFFVQNSFEMNPMIQLGLKILSGFMIVRMGIKAYKSRLNFEVASEAQVLSSWREGFLLQLFNPNPYLFWFLIGVPYMVSLKNPFLALQFAVIFLLVTYGLKSLIIEICARASSGEFFSSKNFIFLRKGISLMTIGNGGFLIVQSLVRI